MTQRAMEVNVAKQIEYRYDAIEMHIDRIIQLFLEIHELKCLRRRV
jgi:hypothetical protein